LGFVKVRLEKSPIAFWFHLYFLTSKSVFQPIAIRPAAAVGGWNNNALPAQSPAL